MKNKPFIIGIAGGTGSGKTTVVDAIRKNLAHQNILTIQHDSYYKDRSSLSTHEKEKVNYDHPDALETDLLIHHLKELSEGNLIEIPVYDFASHSREYVGKSVFPSETIIVEGVLVLTNKELREMMDVKIFVDTDDDIRFIRRLKRDMKERQRSMEAVIKQYMETVRLMHIDFVDPSRKYADIIIPEGHNPIAIDMVVSMIKDKLRAL